MPFASIMVSGPARIAALIGLALLASACETKPKLPPGARPVVEVEGDLLTIVKQTGSQRPAGRLWEDDQPDRLIFLGSLTLGDEEQPLAYGDDPKRDMAGVLERIAPFRWRLVIPWPQSTSKLDVFELTPVAQQPQG